MSIAASARTSRRCGRRLSSSSSTMAASSVRRRVVAIARIVALLKCARTSGALVAPPPPLARSTADTRASSPFERHLGPATKRGPWCGPRRRENLFGGTGTGSTSSTALDAFWSRGSDADGSTVAGDPSRSGANSLWRKLSRRDGTDDVASDRRQRRAARASQAQKTRAAKQREERDERQRRGGALAVTTEPRSSSSERYIYSASYLSELCPSFDRQSSQGGGGENFADECVLDDDFYEGYSAREQGRNSYDRHIEKQRERIERLLSEVPHIKPDADESSESTVATCDTTDKKQQRIKQWQQEIGSWWPAQAKTLPSLSTKKVLRPSKAQSHRVPQPSGTWAGRIVETALTDLVNRHALHTLNLRFDASSPGSPGEDGDSSSLKPSRAALAGTQLLPLLLRGDVPSVRATFDRLSFPTLALSGGGTLVARSVTLNAHSFAPLFSRFGRRFRDPFELRAEGCVVTQEDVRNSRMLRGALSGLLDRILRRVVAHAGRVPAAGEVLEVAAMVAGVEDFVRVDVTGVDIVDNHDLISCTGIITTESDHPDIPFSVRTGLSASHGGRVLHFPHMEMVLEPPGSPLPVVLPLHKWHPVDLDIGDDARIDEVTIDGRRKTLRLSMRAVVTPDKKNKTNQKKRAAGESSAGEVGTDAANGNNGKMYSPAPKLWAKYSVDVGEWLTNVGRFSA